MIASASAPESTAYSSREIDRFNSVKVVSLEGVRVVLRRWLFSPLHISARGEH
jgi:hypothetical protein